MNSVGAVPEAGETCCKEEQGAEGCSWPGEDGPNKGAYTAAKEARGPGKGEVALGVGGAESEADPQEQGGESGPGSNHENEFEDSHISSDVNWRMIVRVRLAMLLSQNEGDDGEQQAKNAGEQEFRIGLHWVDRPTLGVPVAGTGVGWV